MSTIAPPPPAPAAELLEPVTVTGVRTGRRPIPDARPILGISSDAGLSTWMIVMPVELPQLRHRVRALRTVAEVLLARGR